MTVSFAMVSRLVIQLLASAKVDLRLLARIHPCIAASPMVNALLAWMTPTAMMIISSAMAQRLVTRALANAKVDLRLLAVTVATRPMTLASNVLKMSTAMMVSSAMDLRSAFARTVKMVVTAKNLTPTLVVSHPYIAAKLSTHALLVWTTPTVAKASSAMRQVAFAKNVPVSAIVVHPMITVVKGNAEEDEAERLASNVSFRRTLGCVFVKEICLNCNAYVYFRVGSFFLD